MLKPLWPESGFLSNYCGQNLAVDAAAAAAAAAASTAASVDTEKMALFVLLLPLKFQHLHQEALLPNVLSVPLRHEQPVAPASVSPQVPTLFAKLPVPLQGSGLQPWLLNFPKICISPLPGLSS